MKLVFSRANAFTSYAIRLVEGLRAGHLALAPWSHVAVVCADGEHVMDSFSDRGGVTRPRSLASFIAAFPDHRVVDVPCDHAQDMLATDWMLTQVGMAYDWRGLFGFVAGRNTSEKARWYCFDFAAQALHQAGIEVSTDRTDCFKLLRAAGALER